MKSEQEILQEIEELFQRQMALDIRMTQDLKTGWSHLILTDGFIERQTQMSDEFIEVAMESTALQEKLSLDARAKIMDAQQRRRDIAMTEEFGGWWQEQKNRREEKRQKFPDPEERLKDLEERQEERRARWALEDQKKEIKNEE